MTCQVHTTVLPLVKTVPISEVFHLRGDPHGRAAGTHMACAEIAPFRYSGVLSSEFVASKALQLSPRFLAASNPIGLP